MVHVYICKNLIDHAHCRRLGRSVTTHSISPRTPSPWQHVSLVFARPHGWVGTNLLKISSRATSAACAPCCECYKQIGSLRSYTLIVMQIFIGHDEGHAYHPPSSAISIVQVITNVLFLISQPIRINSYLQRYRDQSLYCY